MQPQLHHLICFTLGSSFFYEKKIRNLSRKVKEFYPEKMFRSKCSVAVVGGGVVVVAVVVVVVVVVVGGGVVVVAVVVVVVVAVVLD